MRRDTYRVVLPAELDRLVCAANRYTTNDGSLPKDGLTFIFAHCSSAREYSSSLEGLSTLTCPIFLIDKEQWEVTIEKLFELTTSRSVIREAWALDCQSHGESGILNAEKLRDRDPISMLLLLSSGADTRMLTLILP